MREKYLIALDMDGTLLNDDKVITKKTLKYLKKLSRHGHKIIISSGRPPRSIYRYYHQLKLKTPYIAYNGALVLPMKEKNYPKREFRFPKETAVNILDELKEFAVSTMAENETTIWLDKKDHYLDQFFIYSGMNILEGEIKDILTEDPIALVIKGKRDYSIKNELAKYVDKYDGLKLRYWAGSPYFELRFRDTSKGEAVTHIANFYNIPKERIICFGDAENDIDLLNAAGIKIAMRNGKDCLKEVADRISIRNNNLDGIYYTLKEILK